VAATYFFNLFVFWFLGQWQQLSPGADISWREIAEAVMKVYTTRTLGSFVQKKGSSMTWNHSLSDPEFGGLQVNILYIYVYIYVYIYICICICIALIIYHAHAWLVCAEEGVEHDVESLALRPRVWRPSSKPIVYIYIYIYMYMYSVL